MCLRLVNFTATSLPPPPPTLWGPFFYFIWKMLASGMNVFSLIIVLEKPGCFLLLFESDITKEVFVQQPGKEKLDVLHYCCFRCVFLAQWKWIKMSNIQYSKAHYIYHSSVYFLILTCFSAFVFFFFLRYIIINLDSSGSALCLRSKGKMNTINLSRSGPVKTSYNFCLYERLKNRFMSCVSHLSYSLTHALGSPQPPPFLRKAHLDLPMVRL